MCALSLLYKFDRILPDTLVDRLDQIGVTGGCQFKCSHRWPGDQGEIKTKYMQRLAALSFFGVVLVLVAFTVVHDTKKPDLAVRTSLAGGELRAMYVGK